MSAVDASSNAPLVVLASSRVVVTLPDDSLVMKPATLCICPISGTILSIIPTLLPRTAFAPAVAYKDYSPKILMPGLVDAHVHLNEPGRTEWEGFWTGTRAAASGGVTTVIDMPLNAVPPTTTLEGFKVKLAASQGQCWVDVGFYGGVIPGNADQLLPLVEAGVRGFKGFLIDSGVDEFPAVSSKDISLAMTTLRDSPTTLMFHAEMIPPISDSVGDAVQQSLPPLDPRGELASYSTFLKSRPPAFETYAVEEIVSLADLAPKLHLHIVHLSALECIPILREARARGINITAETCFHYLALASDNIEDGDTRHKCCPPIRSLTNQDRLWAELAADDSCIRTVVSDHSPCTPELKLLPLHLQTAASHESDSDSDDGRGPRTFMRHSDSGVDVSMGHENEKQMMSQAENAGDFFAAWGGISSVGLGLPILHTAATERIVHGDEKVPSLLDMVRLCSQATAHQVGLSHRKGGLRVGLDADVCVFDDEDVWTLRAGNMRWKNKCSPWEGHTFHGRVHETWVRGRKIFQLGGANGGFIGGKPVGRPIVERRTE